MVDGNRGLVVVKSALSARKIAVAEIAFPLALSFRDRRPALGLTRPRKLHGRRCLRRGSRFACPVTAGADEGAGGYRRRRMALVVRRSHAPPLKHRRAVVNKRVTVRVARRHAGVVCNGRRRRWRRGGFRGRQACARGRRGRLLIALFFQFVGNGFFGRVNGNAILDDRDRSVGARLGRWIVGVVRDPILVDPLVQLCGASGPACQQGGCQSDVKPAQSSHG